MTQSPLSFLQGWLTDSGRVNMQRVQIIMTNLGHVEDEIFTSRQERELVFRRRDKQRKMQEKMEKQAAQDFRDNTGELYVNLLVSTCAISLSITLVWVRYCALRLGEPLCAIQVSHGHHYRFHHLTLMDNMKVISSYMHLSY